MNTDMDRRSFVGLVAAAIAAAYVPKSVVDTAIRVTEPLPDRSKLFIVTNAEWFNDPYMLANTFRLLGYPENAKHNKLYCAVRVDDYILHEASREDKNRFIRYMLENIERQIQSHLNNKDIQIVYAGQLEKAIRSKGVRL